MYSTAFITGMDKLRFTKYPEHNMNGSMINVTINIILDKTIFNFRNIALSIKLKMVRKYEDLK